jgi:hypothetical protein
MPSAAPPSSQLILALLIAIVLYAVGRISSVAPPEADRADPWLAKALTVCPILHLICAYIERRKGRALARRPAAGKRYIVREVCSLLPQEQLQPIGGSLGRSIADLRS